MPTTQLTGIVKNGLLEANVPLPIIKKMSAMIGVKMTKDTFAKGISKMIPLAGGVISGGITYSSMTKMGNRLMNTLEEGVNMTEAEFVESVEEVKRENLEIIEGEFIEMEEILRQEGEVL